MDTTDVVNGIVITALILIANATLYYAGGVTSPLAYSLVGAVGVWMGVAAGAKV